MRRVGGFAVVTVVVMTALAGCAAGPLTSGGRTLLTYASSGSSGSAELRGPLRVDERGCIAIGNDVLVVPDGSQLHADGSITVGGKTFQLGHEASFGGGGGNKPAHSACAPGSSYWYV